MARDVNQPMSIRQNAVAKTTKMISTKAQTNQFQNDQIGNAYCLIIILPSSMVVKTKLG